MRANQRSSSSAMMERRVLSIMAPLKYWSCGGSPLTPRSVMTGADIVGGDVRADAVPVVRVRGGVAAWGARSPIVAGPAVEVGEGIGAAVLVLDEERFEVGVPALVDPHVGAVGGGDGVAEPLVAGTRE